MYKIITVAALAAIFAILLASAYSEQDRLRERLVNLEDHLIEEQTENQKTQILLQEGFNEVIAQQDIQHEETIDQYHDLIGLHQAVIDSLKDNPTSPLKNIIWMKHKLENDSTILRPYYYDEVK